MQRTQQQKSVPVFRHEPPHSDSIYVRHRKKNSPSWRGVDASPKTLHNVPLPTHVASDPNWFVRMHNDWECEIEMLDYFCVRLTCLLGCENQICLIIKNGRCTGKMADSNVVWKWCKQSIGCVKLILCKLWRRHAQPTGCHNEKYRFLCTNQNNCMT